MKVALWSVGKVKNRELGLWLLEYQKRLRKYHPVTMKEILIREKSSDPVYLRKIEGDRILAQIHSEDTLILWDERGKPFTSEEFAGFLEEKMLAGINSLIFLIGGPHGFDPRIYQRAAMKLSLSKMTFPHDMARLMVMEQLYRAFSIINHSPYHH